MNYWMTVHWPLRLDQRPPSPFGVYVQNKHLSVLASMRPGDKVLFYESKTGRTLCETRPDGSVRKLRCEPGRMAIFCIAEITGPVTDGLPPQVYDNGTDAWWRWFASARKIEADGRVPLADVLRLLGYKPGGRLRGFGDSHSGTKLLDKAGFNALARVFRSNAASA